MSSNVYTASASIKYLVSKGIPRYKIALAMEVNDLPDIEKGKRPLTRQEYLNLTDKYPILEHSIEYFENVNKG